MGGALTNELAQYEEQQGDLVARAKELADALDWAFAESGPHLIEAAMPSIAG
jgi:thiamine pyrophosphate-dependent acetolactate synthase large subunit-like protein